MAPHPRLLSPAVPPAYVRIFSDLHHGDHASRLVSLPAIAPLLDGPERVIFNGDTIDTRPSRRPEHGLALRAAVDAFLVRRSPPAVLVTGNHDPDISSTHALELAGGAVFVTHGDVIFDDIVPWSQDAPLGRRFFAEEFSAEPAASRDSLEGRLAAVRRASARIPQRHHSERDRLKYALGLMKDTAWPPLRILAVLRAWREAPGRAAELMRRYRPQARFFIMGHTHRRGVTRMPGGLVVINTGAFCPPTGPGVVDVFPDRLVLRAVDRRNGEFHAGTPIAEFALATTATPATLPRS